MVISAHWSRANSHISYTSLMHRSFHSTCQAYWSSSQHPLTYILESLRCSPVDLSYYSSTLSWLWRLSWWGRLPPTSPWYIAKQTFMDTSLTSASIPHTPHQHGVSPAPSCPTRVSSVLHFLLTNFLLRDHIFLPPTSSAKSPSPSFSELHQLLDWEEKITETDYNFETEVSAFQGVHCFIYGLGAFM